MNIYKIMMGHAAPKDWVKVCIGFVLAENEEAVFNWLSSDPKLNGKSIYNSWKEKQEDYERETGEEWDNEEYPDFKSRIIALKGEINDDDYDFTDSYYGITLYGWELYSESGEDGLEYALSLGIITKI